MNPIVAKLCVDCGESFAANKLDRQCGPCWTAHTAATDRAAKERREGRRLARIGGPLVCSRCGETFARTSFSQKVCPPCRPAYRREYQREYRARRATAVGS